jgi:tetratricopeptide (TPR) repeat protein
MYFYAGNAYLGIADFSLAAARYSHAIMLQANFSSGHAGLIFTHLSRGADAQATKQAESFLACPPDEDRYYVKAADVSHFLGNDDVARRLAEEAVVESPMAHYRPRGVCPTTLLGSILQRQGDLRAAEEMLQRSDEANRARLDEGDEGYEAHFDLAAIHAIRGNRFASLRSLEAAIDAGWRAYPLARRDPLFTNLHGDAGFYQLLTTVEVEVAAMRRRAPATGIGRPAN